MAIENAAILNREDFKSRYQHAAISQHVIPLSMVGSGEKVSIKLIGGKDKTRRFLCNLGFVEGAEVSVVSELNGNVIVAIKGTRMAISKAMASRVLTLQLN